MMKPKIMATDSSKGASKGANLSIATSTRSFHEKKDPQEVLNVYVQNTNLPGKANECRPITIFRLPEYIREKSKDMHEPKLVSVGPYYYNSGALRTLEEHKWWCLRDFMETHLINVKDCIQKVEALEAAARQCYSETLSFETDDFVQMLILDGCFILEFIRKHYGKVPDSFFDIERNWETILNDLLLVENQIPFFILHELFNIATGSSCFNKHSCKLRDLIFHLFPRKRQIRWEPPQIPCKNIHHLLHFYYLCMVEKPGSMRSAGKSPSQKSTESGAKVTLGGIEIELEKVEKVEKLTSTSRGYKALLTVTGQYNNSRKKGNKDNSDKPNMATPSVTELHERGVRFRRKKEPKHLLDITFENGIMEIPELYIDDMQCVLLANLLAFEQISYGPKETISHFVSFLDNLIDTKLDVARLEHHRILINMIGSEAEAAQFINQLGKWNIVEHSEFYTKLITKVQAYANSLWPRYRATLMRDYFINPWTTISVVAAIILLVLTMLQTYYTIYSTLNSTSPN